MILISNKLLKRFWQKIEKSTDCWEWTACKSHGYGQLHSNGKLIRAHRLSWIIHHEQIPSELLVLHKCDNPGCVNPSHLFLGTQSDNLRDASKKGRTTGMNNYNTRKTHCIHGHEFTEANTYQKGKRRQCRTCATIHRAAYKTKQGDYHQ